MLETGDTFERYTIEALIGQGGMGAVYRAHDAKLGRRVALKVIATPGAEASSRLLREARAAAALDHPNAVAIFDVGERDGDPFIVMELVEGGTLRALVGSASATTSGRLLADVARTLAAAHKRGLVHRDIKPENVMVRDDGMVKVLDFGIARRASRVDPVGPTASAALATLTLDGVKVGTPVYMAPEQIRGDALDGRADQFSWGVVAYELLTGRLPWRGADDALAVMASVLTDEVDRAPLQAAGVSPVVQDVVLRALSKRAADRFASMDDLLVALEASSVASDPLPNKRPEVAASSAAGATSAQRFSTVEVREVLGKALERQAEKQGSTKLGFDDLLAVAAEVGVDADSLRDATRALRAQGAPLAVTPPRDDAQRAPLARAADARNWVRRQRRDVYRHAGVYAIVNAALLILGLVLLGPWTPWWVWFIPVLAWGVGLAIHALVGLTVQEDDWREEQEQMQAWRERRQHRHDERMAALNAFGPRRGEQRRERERGRPSRGTPDGPEAEQRRRVEAVPEPEREKVRVAAPTGTDAGRELEAEEEARLAEEPARRQRR